MLFYGGLPARAGPTAWEHAGRAEAVLKNRIIGHYPVFCQGMKLQWHTFHLFVVSAVMFLFHCGLLLFSEKIPAWFQNGKNQTHPQLQSVIPKS